MPSAYSSDLDGNATTPKGASVAINSVTTSAKSFGTSTSYTRVTPQRNAYAKGESSTNVISGPTGTWTKGQHASGITVNDLSIGNEIRVGVKGGLILGDGVNSILTTRELLTTGRGPAAGGPLTMTLNGQWIDGSGTITRPASSGARELNVISGSGDLVTVDGRQYPGTFYYRVAKTNVEKHVNPLTT